jgi:hypothetical protein
MKTMITNTSRGPVLGCPSDIEVLLHCHVCPGPHPRFHAPAVQDALGFLLRHGAIEPRNGVENGEYSTTELGKAWVAALCRVPKPRAVFVDADGTPLSSIP